VIRRITTIRSHLGLSAFELLGVLEQKLEYLSPGWRLMLEWHRRVRCGIRRYDVVCVMPRGAWSQLAVKRGTRLCFAGFELFSAVCAPGYNPRVRPGEVAVYFRLEARV
jgi:hypothetical protein